jgi:Tfp pilus assembly protein PilX
MNATRRSARQRGATLLVALIMLVLLTLFAVSAIRTGNIGLKIVGNQQTQKSMEASAQQAIEQVLSNLGNFDPATVVAPTATVAQRICVNGSPPVITSSPSTTACTSGTPVDISPARCISSTRSQYDSLTQPMATFDNVWEFTATVTDSLTGAKAVYHQGIKMRMLANSCPGVS